MFDEVQTVKILGQSPTIDPPASQTLPPPVAPMAEPLPAPLPRIHGLYRDIPGPRTLLVEIPD
jgi:hypothetical protein